MPVELEYKFLVDRDMVQPRDLEDELSGLNIPFKVEIFNQGYLPKAGRLRSITKYTDGVMGSVRYVFTYKHKLSHRPGDFEIETSISQDDFNIGWKDCSFCLKKIRYTFYMKGYVWEVDFFFNGELNYDTKFHAVLIECEVMKEGRPGRFNLPGLLQSAIQYDVPLGDSRFSNKNLSFTDNIEELYKNCK